jgi:hypothetical protein
MKEPMVILEDRAIDRKCLATLLKSAGHVVNETMLALGTLNTLICQTTPSARRWRLSDSWPAEWRTTSTTS